VLRADNIATFKWRVYRNSGSFNLVEPSGPVEVCVGIALSSWRDTSQIFVGISIVSLSYRMIQTIEPTEEQFYCSGKMLIVGLLPFVHDEMFKNVKTIF